ncbi:MAG: serine/threonine-protein kinase [Planctomycetota bacterium]
MPDGYLNITVDGFRIVEKIQEGGTGTIYRAVQSGNERSAAVKFLTPRARQDASLRRAFLREYRIASKLVHPGLLRMFRHGTLNGTPYFLREYFEGETLKFHLLKHPRSSNTDLKTLFLALTDILGYIHRKGFVHLDIKPENILIRTPDRIKIIDFSLAARIWLVRFFPKSRIQGSPSYMAPEQILRKSLGPRTDLYALGATFYEILTGRPPFVVTDRKQLLDHHLTIAPAPPETLNRQVTIEASQIILRMLAKKPEGRPASAQDITTTLYNADILRYTE